MVRGVRRTIISTQLIRAVVAIKGVRATTTMYLILAFKPKNYIVPVATEYGVPGICSENAKPSVLGKLVVGEEAFRTESRG